MPATRSSSSQPRPHSFPSPSPPRKHQATEVIDLSPGPEPCAKNSRVPLNLKRQNKPQSHKKAPLVVTTSTEVIEISSDDEDEAPSEASRIADLRRQMNKNREVRRHKNCGHRIPLIYAISMQEIVKYRKEYERASKAFKEVQEENKRLQALLKPDSGKISLVCNVLITTCQFPHADKIGKGCQ